MADGVDLNAGSGGAKIATDDDGTSHHQYVKVEFGVDNTQTKVTSTVGLPVKLLAGTAEFGKLAAGIAEIGNVKNAGTFAVQSTLQTGSNAIGKLAANSGVDIGDVDVTSVPAPLNVVGGGTEAAALRVTIANNSTGLLSIDDGGGSITVDGTTTEANSAAILSDTASMDTNLGTIAGAVSGSEMQVDVVAALPAGDNNIGNVDIVSGTITAVTDITNDVSIDDGGNSITVDNASIDGPGAPTVDSYTHTAINLTTGADQVLASSAANKQIWVYGYGFTCGDADGQSVSLQDQDDAPLTGVVEFAQYGGMSVAPSGNFSMPIFKLGTDKDLEIDILGGDVDGWITYAIMSV